ncbi:MAG: methionyl-tRNA formyltransferase [Candidatus Omnitrophica bacterium]|nr:methionyl-tRNA formyltransferase [Candidatus Omnitrophota bacterium]
MKILFFGCDDFAAVSLRRLLEAGHKVVGLVTQPDRPRGRGLHVEYSATKELALKAGLEVFQPDTLKDQSVVARLRDFGADLFVVIAYGKLLPADILALPGYSCINVHASLLPRYRGAAPVNWAVINGETETGVTIIRLNIAMDGGDILSQAVCAIPLDMTTAELRPRLAALGADLLVDTIPRISAGTVTPKKQDEDQVSKAPKMHKDLGHIRWTESARSIHDLVRGTQPWPGAFTFWRGKRLKVLDACAASALVQGQPGEIVELHKDGFLVQAGDGAVLVRQVHPESSRPMDARAFLAGHKLSLGEVLG